MVEAAVMEDVMVEGAMSGDGDAAAPSGLGGPRDPGRIVIGRWEWVQFPGFSLQPQRARVGTGARRSSLHATQIEQHAGEVRFALACGAVLQVPLVGVARVRSSNGTLEQRPVVELPATIAGLTVQMQCTLADRSIMRFPVLLGRDLLAGRFMVDPSLGRQHRKPRVSPAAQAGQAGGVR